MNQLLSDWQSPHWWISVVVIGLLLNVVSTYLKSGLEWAFKAVTGWMRARSDRATRRYLERARLAMASDRGLIKEIARGQQHRGSAALWALGAILLLVVVICMGLANQASRTVYMWILGAVSYCIIESIRSVFAALNSSIILDVAESLPAEAHDKSSLDSHDRAGGSLD